MKSIRHAPFVLPALPLLLVAALLATAPTQAAPADGKVHAITTVDELKAVLESSPGRLLMFDLYADWCGPCRILSPMIADIAAEQQDLVSVYKINVEQSPELASIFGVSGIPFVVFVKDKKPVHALTGVQPRGAYVRVIHYYADGPQEKTARDTPDGKLVNGVRVIRLSTATSPNSLYVYRGEEIKLIIDDVDFPYSVHIPAFGVSKEATVGKDLEITFKAREVGTFPIYCNGQCPSGDGARYGNIVVMPFEAAGATHYAEVSAAQAQKLIAEVSPLVLDVRTPSEYYGGHLEGAVLIPLQQLEGRISEIEKYKDQPILVYCRSGNRSVVASEILTRHGFTKLYNLTRGIIEWRQEGYRLVQ